MNFDARATSLERFGYTPRQARFLTLAALHSGYFMRRQYVAFTGGAHGVAAVGFIRRVLERGHAAVIEAPVVGRLYHLGSKPLYAALGEVDNRNRRLHSASSIRRRLMALDFILAHPHDTFLATERDRLAYFVDEQQLPASALPTTAYVSTDGRATTTRFFVDKLPIATRGTGIVFAYIDDDEATVGGFATFLERHRALFAALRVNADVVLVTTVPRHVARAETFCEHALRLSAARHAPGVEALAAYVRARLRLDQGRLSGCPQQELDALRRDLAAIPSATGDDMYARWCRAGDAALHAWVQHERATTPIGVVAFSGYILPHVYGIRPGVRSYHG
jgi:hypothetical protein